MMFEAFTSSDASGFRGDTSHDDKYWDEFGVLNTLFGGTFNAKNHIMKCL